MARTLDPEEVARRIAENLRLLLRSPDSGPGIPPEMQERIFEPFFTTKPPGEGTGLGLSLCRNIVEAHDGAIRLVSALGDGARFVIELPVRAAADRPQGSADPVAVEPAAPNAVLVVDDEREVAELLGESLRRRGHQVDIVGDGATALEMLEQRHYDLVLADTRMPVMDGLTMYREIERRFPHLRRRVIFVTGDVLNAQKEAFFRAAAVSVVTKPFEIRDVMRVVDTVLAEAPA